VLRSIRLSILSCAVLLAACVTTEGYQEIVTSWVGSSEADLVSSWGAPQGVYDAGSGERILTYSSRRQFTTTNYTYIPNPYTGVGISVPSGQTLHDRQCTTNFTVRNGVVVASSFQGNDCRA